MFNQPICSFNIRSASFCAVNSFVHKQLLSNCAAPECALTFIVKPPFNLLNAIFNYDNTMRINTEYRKKLSWDKYRTPIIDAWLSSIAFLKYHSLAHWTYFHSGSLTFICQLEIKIAHSHRFCPLDVTFLTMQIVWK